MAWSFDESRLGYGSLWRGATVKGGTDDANDESMIATAFYRLGVWDDEPDDLRQAEFDDFGNRQAEIAGRLL